MVDQSNPFGSLRYSENGTNPDGTPKFQADTTLSAPMQGIFDKSTGLANTLLSNGEGALSGKGPDLSYGATEANLNALDAKRLDPQWEQNTKHQEDVLYSRGIRPGTEAYDNEMRVFNQGKNDAYTSSLSKNHGQAVSDIMTQYNSPRDTLGSVFGIAKGTNPQFTNTPTTNIPGTNVAGLISDNYKQESANANAQNGQMAGLIGTGMSLAAAPFTGGASLLGAGASMGGLFGGGGGGVMSQANPYDTMPMAAAGGTWR